MENQTKESYGGLIIYDIDLIPPLANGYATILWGFTSVVNLYLDFSVREHPPLEVVNENPLAVPGHEGRGA